MTHTQNIARIAHRRAIAALLAAAALPATAMAQETVTPPPVLVPAQPAPAAPAPTPARPPVATTPTQAGESRTRIAPGVIEQAEQEAQERAAARRAERAEARPPQRAARPAPAPVRERTAPPVAAAPVEAPAPVTPESAAPTAATPETVAPVETAPVAAEAPVTPVEPVATTEPVADNGGSSLWLILAGLGLLAAAIAAFLLLRRRRDEDVAYEAYRTEPESVAVTPEPVRETPVAPTPRAPDPVAAAPLFGAAPIIANARDTSPEPIETPVAASEEIEVQPALENAELVKPDAEDIDAVLGGAAPHGTRPQLELAMRPTRAGMSARGAMVEFELTVANAGGVSAEDVRIGAFMLGSNAAADSDIERLLLDPPVDQVVPAERIEPGDGTRLNASVTLPREQVDAVSGEVEDGFTPVLVADARYRLPDGSEGRTSAAFTIGRVNGGEALVPIAFHDDPAMYGDIEARLHSVPAKT